MPIPARATQPAADSHRTSPAVPPVPRFEFHISNRNSKFLEISVTPTKHSLEALSNRNKNSGIACRAGCSPTTPKIRRSPETVAGPLIQRRLPVEAGSPPARSGRLLSAHRRTRNCASLRLTHAQPAPTGSPLQILNPGSLRPLVRFFARLRTACAAGYSTARACQPARLHVARVTAGQRSAPTRQPLTSLAISNISNRNKNTILSPDCTGVLARARSALDCGRSATALLTSTQSPTHHAPSGHASMSVTAGQRSALTRQPLTYLLTPTISNRQWKGLETAVTHRKQTPDSFLIDNENAVLRIKRSRPPSRSTSSSKSSFYEKV